MKTIKIRVIPNAKKDEVTEGNNILKIRLKAKAEGGKANRALIEIISEYFGVKKAKIRIVAGEISREKIIEVSE